MKGIEVTPTRKPLTIEVLGHKVQIGWLFQYIWPFGLLLIWGAPHLIGVIFPDVPRAKVYVGDPLPWRVLSKFDQSIEDTYDTLYLDTPALGAVNLENDTDEELLVRYPEQKKVAAAWHVFSVDGTATPLGLGLPADNAWIIPWDWDGDGEWEFLGQRWNYTSPLPDGSQPDYGYICAEVYSRNGSVLHEYGNVYHFQMQKLADLAGNGDQQFIEFNYVDSYTYANDYHGGQKLPFKMLDLPSGSICLDFDGDGCDEIAKLWLGYNQKDYQVFGFDDIENTEIAEFQTAILEHSGDMEAVSCDRNADGIDEIVVPRRGYFDPATGITHYFQWPREYGEPMWQHGRKPCPVFDVDNDGEKEFITFANLKTAFGMLDSTAFCAFDQAGMMIYYEEMGAGIQSIAVINSGGRDYLAVMLDDRLVICP